METGKLGIRQTSVCMNSTGTDGQRETSIASLCRRALSNKFHVSADSLSGSLYTVIVMYRLPTLQAMTATNHDNDGHIVVAVIVEPQCRKVKGTSLI